MILLFIRQKNGWLALTNETLTFVFSKVTTLKSAIAKVILNSIGELNIEILKTNLYLKSSYSKQVYFILKNNNNVIFL